MSRRTLPVLVVAALLPTAFVVLTDDERSIEPASSRTAASVARLSADGSRSGFVVPQYPRGTPEPGRDPAHSSAPLPKSLQLRTGTADDSARLIVNAPPFIDQSSTQDVVVAVRMPSGARSVEFTVSADPDLIQLRDASRGAGSPRGEASFEAYVDEVANRIAIKVQRGGGWLQGESVDLAVVRIDGMAPGSATITVSEIGAKDAAGAAIEIAPKASAQLLVMSGPI
jgi:hypothetical protein